MPVTTVMSTKQASSSMSSPSSPSRGSRSSRFRAEIPMSVGRAFPLERGEMNRGDLGRECRAGDDRISQSLGMRYLNCRWGVQRSEYRGCWVELGVNRAGSGLEKERERMENLVDGENDTSV